MKILNIPHPKYDYYDANLIPQTLDGYQQSESKRGNHNRTLFGAYKMIRIMPLHAGLGDFIILSACVKWLRSINQSPTETEIRRCMIYFQPSLTIREKRQLTKTFFVDDKSEPDRPVPKKKIEAKKKAKTNDNAKKV